MNPPGEAGIFRSLAVMRQMIIAAAPHPTIRRRAAILSRGIAPGDHDARLEAILSWVRANLSFLPDPVGVEAIASPVFHVQSIEIGGGSAGDCDDAATLLGALARSIGRPVRLHVASFRPDRKLHHVWTDAAGARAWLQLDPFRAERFSGIETRGEVVNV